MKKIFLTEADRKKIISDREKAIVESFAKTFNKIKRLDENEIGGEDYDLTENDRGVSYEFYYDGIVNDNDIVYDTIQKIKDEYNGLGIGFGHDNELIIAFPSPLNKEQLQRIKEKYNSTLRKLN